MKLISSFITVCLIASVIFAGDAWITSGTDPEYPNTLYFSGVGLSERGQSEAKNNAVVEIKKQLSVRVKASVLDEQMSLSQGGVEVARSNKVETRARLSTEGEVQGIEVVKTAEKGKIYYAFAVLDKKNFESNARTRIKELKEELEKRVKGAEKDIASASIGTALKKLAAAKKIIRKILEQRTLLSAAAPITGAEKLNYTNTDIAVLYEKCVGSIKTKKISGDKQETMSGMIPVDPFVVKVTSGDMPVAMLPLILKGYNKKTLMLKYTNDDGMAEFFLGEQAESEMGVHKYTVEIGLKVSSSSKSILKAQKQVFTYKVNAMPCYVNIIVEVAKDLISSKSLIAKKVTKRLAKYDVMHDPQACYSLKVSVSAKETGYVQGISEARTVMKTDVTTSFELFDKDNKQVAAFEKKSVGTGGNPGKSAAKGVEIMKIKTDIVSINRKICQATYIEVEPKKKIAVFPFKSAGFYSNWFDISRQISDMVITRLINTQVFDVIERSQLETLMEEKKLAMSGLVETDEALELGQYAGADFVLIGTAGIHGRVIDVDARIVDAKTGVAKGATSVTGYSLTNLRKLANALVEGMKIGGKKITAPRRKCK